MILNKVKLSDWAVSHIMREVYRTRIQGMSERQRAALYWSCRRPVLLNANNPLPYDASVIAAVNAFTALLNSGTIKIFTGAQPALNGALSGTLLVTMTFGATAFPTAVASAGTVTATANAITSGTAGNTGTAGYHALVSSGSATVATGSVGTSGADLNMTTLSVVSTNNVSCGSYLVNMAET